MVGRNTLTKKSIFDLDSSIAHGLASQILQVTIEMRTKDISRLEGCACCDESREEESYPLSLQGVWGLD